jgi:pyruvyltransferase
MKQKLLKQVRWLRWSLPSRGAIGFRWHVGRPNFGDDLNPFLWQALLGQRVRLARRGQDHVLGMGSILEQATDRSLVAGSGFLRPPAPGARIHASVLSVRGMLSAACLDRPVLLGDPAVLSAMLFPRSSRPKTPLGVVPHVSEVDDFLAKAPPGVEIIDVRRSPIEVVCRIADCTRIVSRSLHGLIVADAYEVPNVWLAPSSRMAGGEFKFHDYYSTTDRHPVPEVIEPEGWGSVDPSRFSVAGFRFDRRNLLEGLRDGVRSWLERDRVPSP